MTTHAATRDTTLAPALGATDEPSDCPVCGGGDGIDFFRIDRIPVHVCMLGRTRQEALDAPTGRIQLTYCRTCGFVRNRHFDPGLLSFEPGYEASLTHSETFRRFMEGLADRLVELHDLHDKTIVEVGCGTGYFLKLVCGRGGCLGIGFDPTIPSDREESIGTGRVRLIRDYYSPRYASLQPDFLACLSVLEDIPDPVSFLRGLRELMRPQPTAGVYLEVFNGMRAIHAQETWSIHYEQCNYYGTASFARVAMAAGFEVLDASTCYGGDQYVYVDAHRGQNAPSATATRDIDRPVPAAVREFADVHHRAVERWSARLDRLRLEGRPVAIWGTGGKGISFLNGLDTQEAVTCAVDINPDRQGLYTPGTGHPIVAPGHLAELRPAVVIITNRLYETEIRRQVSEMGLTPEFLVA